MLGDEQLLTQPFSGTGDMLCAGCKDAIEYLDIYLVVGQRTSFDTDPKLAVHADLDCLSQLKRRAHE